MLIKSISKNSKNLLHYKTKNRKLMSSQGAALNIKLANVWSLIKHYRIIFHLLEAVCRGAGQTLSG